MLSLQRFKEETYLSSVVIFRRSEHADGETGYPREFRRRVLELIEAGRRIAEVATSVSANRRFTRGGATIASTRATNLALSSVEHGELGAAHKRIRELETELAVHRRATELLKGAADPKAGSRRSK